MVDVLVVGDNDRDVGEALAIFGGAGETQVLAYGKGAESAKDIAAYGVKVYALKDYNPEVVAFALNDLYKKLSPKFVVGITTKNNRDIFSRVAGLNDLPLATDVYDVKIEGDVATYKRGILSGRAISTERVKAPAMLLAAPRKVKPIEKKGGGEVEELSVSIEPKLKIVERKPKERGGVNIEEAEIIVSVGRGFKKKEDLKLAFELAELLGAQIGCSRPIAADLKWLSEDHWVGLSGHKVAPKVYFAIGISGAPQHLAGITDAKIVVAINKDKSAPIFKNADYGVVADLYQFIPVLIKKIKERKGLS
jgi:electron transfer flavoprotein alpha subunit